MKVLYIYLDNVTSLGVVKKVKSKIKLLSKSGIEIEGIFLNRKIQSARFEDNISFVPLSIPVLPLLFNRRYIRNFKLHFQNNHDLKYLYKALNIEVAKREFDVILFRYPISNKYLYRFCKKYKNKIVFEHNTKELVELQLNDKRDLDYKNELKYGSKVLSNSRGIIGVGHEVVQYQLERSNCPDLSNAVIPNSIEVDELKTRDIPYFDEISYNFLFLTGSPSSWVGIDIVLKSLSEFKDVSKKINLYIVGKENSKLVQLSDSLNLNASVHFVGEKKGIELDYYFNNCHLAFGTMAMQRVGLSEGSSLKVLEYASRGIPFVVGYDDNNFENNKAFEPFFLKIPYNNKPFDFQKVIVFTNEVFKSKEHPAVMRGLSLKFLDTSLKMKQLSEFLVSLK